MKKIKLTNQVVDKLPEEDDLLIIKQKKQVEYYDTELQGFGLRLSTTKKQYFFRGHIGSKRVRVTMKDSHIISATEARARAIKIAGQLADGIDPNQIAKEKIRQNEEKIKEEKQQGITLQEALDEYLQKGKLKPRTLKTYKDLFRLYLNDWLGKPAAEITRDMVRHRHFEIANGQRLRQVFKKEIDIKNAEITKVKESKRREAAADNCFRTLRAVLNYTFEDEEGGIPYANPVSILSSRKRKAWYKVERRRTLVRNSALQAWAKAVDSLDNDIVKDFLLFLLHTGLRKNEAAKLKWSQVDFQERCFTIPDTKNKEPHTLPLSDYLTTLLKNRKDGLDKELVMAKAVMEENKESFKSLPLHKQQHLINRIAMAEYNFASQYVFPGTGKSGYLQEPKGAIETVTATTGIIFSCHDLRRTFATIADSLYLSRYTVKALLNHKFQENDVTEGYIIKNYDMLRSPMQKITNAIQGLILNQNYQVNPID